MRSQLTLLHDIQPWGSFKEGQLLIVGKTADCWTLNSIRNLQNSHIMMFLSCTHVFAYADLLTEDGELITLHDYIITSQAVIAL